MAMRVAWLVFLVALTVIGCGLSFDPDLGAGGEIACGVGGTCPPGFVCAFDDKCYPPHAVPSSQPELSIDDVTVTEGSAAQVRATFRVTLSGPPARSEVSVDYTTVDVTATAGVDYVAAAGTLTFPVGTTTQTIDVTVNGDSLSEAEESFLVRLTNPRAATIKKAEGVGKIQDDDAPPSASIGDVTRAEGNAGSTDFAFVVTLSAPSGKPVVIDYTTRDATALAGSDYTAVSGSITIPPGATTGQIDVAVTGDESFEQDETFTVVLTRAEGATLADPEAVGTIQNDDGMPAISVDDVRVTEGNGGTVDAVFTLRLSAPSGQVVQVGYATADGTAIAGSDYVTAAGTAVFQPGTATQTVTVKVNGDTLHEPDETFLLKLDNASNATLGDAVAIGTIANDDAAPTLSIGDVSVAEGDLGTKDMTFTVTLSAPSGQIVSVTFATADGTATVAGGDYFTATGTLTFPPGVTTQTIGVQVRGDALDEADETFVVNLSAPVNATIGDGQGIGTILNDDTPPTISIGDVTLTEGNVGTKVFAFPVTLSSPSGRTVTVSYATADGTATAADNDYVAVNATLLTLAPGVTSLNANVTVNGDAVDEPNEGFGVVLSAPTNATIAVGTATGTILNDDGPLPTLTVNDVSAVEGNQICFTVTLSAASASNVTVDYATTPGTATAGVDYTPTNGTLTFLGLPTGETTKQVCVPTAQDALDEANETFFLDLSSPINANISGPRGVGTITDDDPQPTIFIDDVSVNEGNAGTTTLTFTVSLSAASGQPVSVSFASADGTATTAGSDYQATSGTLTFPPGTTTQTISVTVNGDTLNEPDETVLMNLSNPTNATIADTQGVGTITNDDPLPTISIDDVTATEGNAGTKGFTFTVTLSAASGQTVTVSYATADGTTNPATAGNDYTSTSGTLTFPPGVTSRQITVSVAGDINQEPNETFFVDLTSPTNATIADGRGVGTIINDDSITISINDVSVTEGNGGNTQAIFTVTLSASSTQTITVSWATADGTATIANSDYTAGSGSLTFAPGVLAQTITVNVRGDTVFEADETFFVNLTNPTNATIADGQGQGTIANDDTPPTLAINDVSITEGNTGTQTLTFTVTKTGATGTTATVNYATADGLATAGSDYAATSGTLTFLPNEVTKTISVTIASDTTDEVDETFFVNLSNAVNATIAKAQGVGTIIDNDPPPTLSINDASRNEGDTGSRSMTFTVTLSAASGKTVTVQYATADGTARAGSDYTAVPPTTLTFNPGVTSLTLTVSILGDTNKENNETFFVNLSSPVNATIADGQGIGTIIDDD